MKEVFAGLIFGWADISNPGTATKTNFVTIDFLVREPLQKLIAGKLSFEDLGSNFTQQVTKSSEVNFLSTQPVALITQDGIFKEKPTQIWKEIGASETHLFFSYSLKKKEKALAIWNFTPPHSLALKSGLVSKETEIKLREVSYNLNKAKLKSEYHAYKDSFKSAFTVHLFQLKGKSAYIVSAHGEIKAASEMARSKRAEPPRLRWAGIFDEKFKKIGTIVDFVFDTKEQLDSMTPLAFLDLDADGTDEMVSQRTYYEGSYTHIGKLAQLKYGQYDYDSREIAGDGH